MLMEKNAFDSATAEPVHLEAAGRADEKREQRQSMIVLSVLLAYAAVWIGSIVVFGGAGLISMSLVSTVLAGAWILYACTGRMSA
jgi:hypothetical protein